MENIIETERLALRLASANDVDFIFTLLNDSSWKANIGDRNITKTSDAQDYINKTLIASYDSNGFGLYIVQVKSTAELIGLCGLLNRDSLEGVDLGYALLPKYWGYGYAVEAAKATLHHECSTHGFEHVQAITLPTNKPSKSLLEKMGFEYQNQFSTPEDPELLDLYRYSFQADVSNN